MSVRTERRTFAGKDFKVVDPASIGHPGHTLHTFDDHEPPFLKYWPRITPGEVVVDVGACMGAYTLPALAIGAKVIAYEPWDDGAAILEANVRENGWTARFELVPFGLWDGESEYPKELRDEVWTRHYPEQREVFFDSLDKQFVEERIDWIKLDPEGAELGILQGAQRLLAAFHPTLIIEDHEGVSPEPDNVVSRYPESIHSSQRIHSMLADLGYCIEVMRHDVSRKYICAVHPSRPAHMP